MYHYTENLSAEEAAKIRLAFEWNTKAIAAAVAEYATSFESLGPVNATAAAFNRNKKRQAVPAHKHNHEGGCGKEVV